jgi:hypothetical protein
VAKVYAAESGIGGRAYLSDVVLFGLTGKIEVNGRNYDSSMPAWSGQFSYQQIADVLNYLITTFRNEGQPQVDFRPYAGDEIGTEAGKGLDGEDVYREREALTALRAGSDAGERSVEPPPAATGAIAGSIIPIIDAASRKIVANVEVGAFLAGARLAATSRSRPTDT